MEQKFKLSDKVRHLTTPEIEMVVVGFDVEWPNDLKKTVDRVPNYEFPICTYFNKVSGNWERKVFSIYELELIPEK
ncbi:hypothetical protein J2Y45_003076 [Dyadobacter sp. BE34]|uniref:Uncharacterized protein n=1 Tax=Dyadobacter fermentans TaxID=94254 RepID=A0ABU1QTX2_9BACT|nr:MULTISPECIES: hypothetical protein [Dyadobacter]MDR6804616.1 hypothetical protein [Dyadobacter fermentans]MDR7043625.1 hypothetical protein [Dyadobacter sp. BE242]MDR7197937.1 hypothetical protein [Dyadobacter sp. BE34]MDR7214630.1 hypothetical protein [Dyadobacter sp. BE31]MDR7262165.1 hypothetical protein [Dyadobacter sp. BE32]